MTVLIHSLAKEKIQSFFNGLYQGNSGRPVQQVFCIGYAGLPILDIFISFPVKSPAFRVNDSGKRRKPVPEGMGFKFFNQHPGKVLYGGLIVRVSNVDDLVIASMVFVLNDAKQTFHSVGNIGKTALLFPPVHQLNRGPFYEIQDQLGDGP
jgi:hypothetical protein